jgi:hypothetical protein
MMQPTRIRHSHNLSIMQPVNFLFYRVFTKENATSFLRKSSSPFLLQELRPLTPPKATDTFTSLTVIGMTKIMCNKSLIVIIFFRMSTTVTSLLRDKPLPFQQACFPLHFTVSSYSLLNRKLVLLYLCYFVLRIF